MEQKFKYPTEQIELPSKGLLYPVDSPLSKGVVEMKYMTAKEEDILSNANFIRQGIVIDKLLQSMIITPINYNDLLNGDKNAILIAARVLGYGKDYTFNHYSANLEGTNELTIDLTLLKEKILDESLITRGKNEFYFKLPHTGNEITFKMLTHGDELNVDKEIQGLKKIDKNSNFDMTTRLRHIILSVNGDYDKKTIREFIEYGFLAKDSIAFREYVNTISPGIDLYYTHT
jgi:hypothetical protein